MSKSAPTLRTQVKRLPERGAYDRATIYRILDDAFVCHVGFVVDGQPYVIPTNYGRSGDMVYIHGSTASRMLRMLSEGVPVCVTVTLIDGLVLARSGFHSSVNYRSVVILGRAMPVEDPGEKEAALAAFSEHLMRGRWKEIRAPSEQELKGTTVLALPLDEASAKIRTGPPKDDEADYDLPVWAGVLPLRVVADEPIPDPRLRSGIRVPLYVRNFKRRAKRPVRLFLGLCIGAALLALGSATRACQASDAADGFLARSYHSPAGETMQYRLFVPGSYDASKRFPLVLWLHNALGRGEDNLAQISGTNYLGTHIWITPDNQAKHAAFVLAPQVSETKAWARPHANTPPVSLRLALEVLGVVEQEFSIDLDRVYVAGQSMGGEGVWAALAVAPDRFAAAIALCGYGFDDMIPGAAKTPVWIFQGEADEIVPVERARLWAAALRNAGGSPKYTEFPGLGHNVWEKAFADPTLIEWLMFQRRAGKL